MAFLQMCYFFIVVAFQLINFQKVTKVTRKLYFFFVHFFVGAGGIAYIQSKSQHLTIDT